jgi:DNA-binding transcriptional LysR family regulator
MDKLIQLRVFVRLAERNSFSAVGRDLGVTQSAVSKAVTTLERALGVRLVNRSTRSVSLTEAGSRYYERCRQILADLEEADAAVGDSNLGMSGTLKITAPVPFGLMFVAPRVARFQARHSALKIDLDLNDRPLNLVEEHVDVAIRLGHLTSPGLVARKLGDSPFVAVASPAYLSLRGTPRAPKDLTAHNCLAYTQQASQPVWTFEGGANPHSVTVAGNYRSNNLLALKEAAIAGVGIARLPLWMADADIKAGSLRLVLENFQPPVFGIHAVFPSARRIPAKVKLFVDFMQDELSSVPYFLGMRRSPVKRPSSK